MAGPHPSQDYFPSLMPMWPMREQVADQLREAGIRVEVDARQEKIGYKIREAQLQKIPYMLVIGDREVENNTLPYENVP